MGQATSPRKIAKISNAAGRTNANLARIAAIWAAKGLKHRDVVSNMQPRTDIYDNSWPRTRMIFAIVYRYRATCTRARMNTAETRWKCLCARRDCQNSARSHLAVLRNASVHPRDGFSRHRRNARRFLSATQRQMTWRLNFPPRVDRAASRRVYIRIPAALGRSSDCY